MAGLFRSYADASAPILSGNSSGSLISILKAVLVDGYGTIDPLGWEIPFEDTVSKICVFRPINGTFRPFVQVKDNNSTTPQYSDIIVYESMSDVNTGIFPCPNVAVSPDHYIIKSMFNTAIAIPWYIIGDDRGFWFLTRPYDQTGNGTGTGNGKLFLIAYIGEYTCNILNNTYNWMTLLCANTGYYPQLFNNATQQHAKLGLQRDPETLESGAVHPYPLVALYSESVSSASYYTIGIGLPNCSPKNEQYFYDPVTFKYNNSYTIGTIPGLFSMLWQSPTYEGGAYWYRQSESEMVPFFDGDMFVFPLKTYQWDYSSVVGRGAILTGDGFRNAY